MVYPKTALCWIIFTLGFTGIASVVDKIEVKESNDQLSLNCPYTSCTWTLNGNSLESKKCFLSLGSVWDDPRGNFSCQDAADHNDPKKETFIEVYVRKCQNCIELDAGTISGFIIADLIMIGFIAVAVYFVSGSETRRPGRASDKQNLIQDDPGYQELGSHRNDEYSMPGLRTRNAI
ncbi:T-cell surface glycoprotein CD3 gamma chain-like [Aquarana catesbeiana]|uniref:T-cell surface glycoprotein CD3 gamma chain-like n=1 Tax=Aquarana catesbeiana TaxID=8400 RepID=UPI003CC93EB7